MSIIATRMLPTPWAQEPSDEDVVNIGTPEIPAWRSITEALRLGVIKRTGVNTFEDVDPAAGPRYVRTDAPVVAVVTDSDPSGYRGKFGITK